MKLFDSHDYISYRTQQVVPSMAFDPKADFDTWKQAAREKLTQLLCLPLTPCEDLFAVCQEREFPEYRRLDFEFQTEEGYFASASMLLPPQISGPLPAVICLQGHSTGMHISLGECIYPNDDKAVASGRDFAVRAVKEGLCAVTLEQRYMGSAGRTETGAPACLGRTNNAGMATLLLGRTIIGERVWDIQRLIDVLCKHFSNVIDPKKIICLGNSGGGTATFYASCLDERICISVPSCAVCTYDESIMAMQHCPCNFVPGIRRYFNMGDLGCLIAPRKLLLVCGEKDHIFPLPGVQKSFDIIQQGFAAAGVEQNCQMLIGNAGHQFYPDQAWPIIHSYLASL